MIAGGLIQNGLTLKIFGVTIYFSVPLIVLITLLIGALIGVFNGFLITRFNVAPFIATLGTMYVCRGFANLHSNGATYSQLSGLIAALGHMDMFMIGDAGMPIPKGIPIVDLALCGGVPTFIQTMNTVLEEAEVEHYTIAEEIVEKNPELHAYIKEKLPNVESEMVPHAELKKMSANVRFAIRTGEFSPYPNIIVRAGVTF